MIPMIFVIMGIFSKYNADKSAAAFVYNAADGFLKFKPCFLGHSSEFCMESFVNKLMERFSEDVGFPDFCRIFLKFIKKITNKVFALFFASDNGRDLRCYICPHKMD